jgi:hypothetical protein
MSAQTAFLVIQLDNGSWQVLPNVQEGVTTERAATELDVKRACTEVLESLNLKDISRIVASVITESSRSDQEKTSETVRESLRARGLL